MATPHPPKRIRLLNSTQGQVEVGKIVSDAQSIPFPWTEAVPEQIRNCFAKSHNTASEYVFVGGIGDNCCGDGIQKYVL